MTFKKYLISVNEDTSERISRSWLPECTLLVRESQFGPFHDTLEFLNFRCLVPLFLRQPLSLKKHRNPTSLQKYQPTFDKTWHGSKKEAFRPTFWPRHPTRCYISQINCWVWIKIFFFNLSYFRRVTVISGFIGESRSDSPFNESKQQNLRSFLLVHWRGLFDLRAPHGPPKNGFEFHNIIQHHMKVFNEKKMPNRQCFADLAQNSQMATSGVRRQFFNFFFGKHI